MITLRIAAALWLLLALSHLHLDAVEFSDFRAGPNLLPSESWDVSVGDGLLGKKVEISVIVTGIGNIVGTLSVFGNVSALGNTGGSQKFITNAVNGRVTMNARFLDGSAHCASVGIKISVRLLDDNNLECPVIPGEKGGICGIEVRRSQGTSWIDNLRESHVHDAWDIPESTDSAPGCSPCGSSGGPDKGLGLHRFHRYRDMAWRGSFGPGVFTQFDHQLRLTGDGAGTVIEWFNPEGDAPVVVRPSATVGAYEDFRYKEVRRLVLRSGDGVPVGSRQSAVLADLERWNGEVFRFEIVPAPSDQPAGLGFARLTRHLAANGDVLAEVAYVHPIVRTGLDPEAINWWGSHYWNTREIQNGTGQRLTFTYGTDMGMSVIESASNGAVSVSYRYNSREPNALIGLTGVRYGDGSESAFSVRRQDDLWLVTYQDAGASGVHRAKTIGLTGTKATTNIVLGSGGAVDLPVAIYPNRVRKVWNGAAELVWSGSVSYEGEGRFISFVEEAGVAKSLVIDNGKVASSRWSEDSGSYIDPRTRSWIPSKVYETNDQGQVTAVIDRIGRKEHFVRDQTSGLVIEKYRQLGPFVTPKAITEYDAVSWLPVRQVDRIGTVTEMDWSSSRKPLMSRVRAGGSSSVQQWQYDERGNVLREIDQNGNSTDYQYDASDRLLAKIAPPDDVNGVRGVTRYGYDMQGRLERVTDPAGRITLFGYDQRGRLQVTTYADGTTETTTWGTTGNGTNNIIERKDRNGAVTTIDYDAAGRPVVETVKEVDGVSVARVRSWTYRPGTEQVLSEIDNGVTISYTYDARGRVIARTRAISALETQTVSTDYDEVNRPWLVTDHRGRRTWHLYDLEDRVIRTVTELLPSTLSAIDDSASLAREQLGLLNRDHDVNPDYLIEDQSYDAEGRVLTQVDAAGIVTTSAYDGFGRLVSRVAADRFANGAINMGASRTVYTYDPVGNEVRVTQPRSFARSADGSFTKVADHATSMTYTGRNLLASRTEAVDSTIEATVHQTWTLTGKLSSVSDPRNPDWITTYGYGSCCDRVTSITDPLGFITRFGYDGVGNQTAITDRNGLVVSMVYDALGRLVSRTDGTGQTTQFTYDANLTDGLGIDGAIPQLAQDLGFGVAARGSATRVTDPTGVSQVEVRDGAGRLVRQRDGAGRITSTVFDFGTDLLESATQTDPLSHTTVVKMDGRGNVRSITTASGTIARSYDARGLLLQEQDPNLVASSRSYDAHGRIIRDEASSGIVTKFTYDLEGNTVSRVDGFDKPTTFVYDSRNRKISETDRLLNSTQFDYDLANNLIAITDSQGGITRYTYSARGELLTEVFPGTSGGTRTMTYDAGGRVKTRKDQRNITTTFDYDGANRLLKRTYSTGYSDTLTYDVAGRLLSGSNSRYATSVTRAFTGGELTRDTQKRNDGTTVAVSTSYDRAGRVVGEGITGGLSWVYGVDALGRRNSANLDGKSVFTRNYDESGRVSSTMYANGIEEQRTYDRYSPLRITAGTQLSPTGVMNISYLYDANRRKTRESNGAIDGDVQTFGYDHEDRLTSWTRTPGAIGTSPNPSDNQSWTLSKVGDWVSMRQNGITENRTHSPAHEITAVNGQALTHDAAGNLTRDALGQKFVWDEENRLASGWVMDPVEQDLVSFTCSYDSFGRRLTRQVGTRRTDYTYQGVQVLSESDRRVTVQSAEAASDGVLSDTAPAPPHSILTMTGARHINIQPANEAIPEGWLADKGRSLAVRTHGLTYGWQTKTGVATSLNAGTQLVVRQFMPQPIWDTHGLPVSGASSLQWRYQVPTNNTTYAVVVVAGDPKSLQHTNHMTVNGVALTDPDPYNANVAPGYNLGDFDGWAQTVTVTDGFITLAPGVGSFNPALCFVEISPAGGTADQATKDRLAALVTSMTNRTSQAPYPPPIPTPRAWVYGGEYVDATMMMLSGSGLTAKRHFIHNNHLFTPQAVTDESGNTVERYTYTAYGQRTVLGASSDFKSDIGMNRGFTGYQLDEESRLYYARARMYSPELGRFVSRDPAGYVDGHNLYMGYFVPNAVDPSGLMTPDEFEAMDAGERKAWLDKLKSQVRGDVLKSAKRYCVPAALVWAMIANEMIDYSVTEQIAETAGYGTWNNGSLGLGQINIQTAIDNNLTPFKQSDFAGKDDYLLKVASYLRSQEGSIDASSKLLSTYLKDVCAKKELGGLGKSFLNTTGFAANLKDLEKFCACDWAMDCNAIVNYIPAPSLVAAMAMYWNNGKDITAKPNISTTAPNAFNHGNNAAIWVAGSWP